MIIQVIYYYHIKVFIYEPLISYRTFIKTSSFTGSEPCTYSTKRASFVANNKSRKSSFFVNLGS